MIDSFNLITNNYYENYNENEIPLFDINNYFENSLSNKIEINNDNEINIINYEKLSLSPSLESLSFENRDDRDIFIELENPFICMNKKSNAFSNSTIEISKIKINDKIENMKTNKLENKIFRITKFNKNSKVGRKKKNTNYKVKHTKFSEDNLIIKIKRNLVENCIKYINTLYKKHYLKSGIDTQIKLLKINPTQLYNIKRSENLKWLNMKLKDVLSTNISRKYIHYSIDYNYCIIYNILRQNEAIEIINILNKTIKDMLKDYIENNKKDGFATLNDDLMVIKERMITDKEEKNVIEHYLNKYEFIAKNLEKIFINKIPRINNDKKHL